MSQGIRLEDIAWQAFQAGGGGARTDADHERLHAAFTTWWALREGQGCATPECSRCGFDPTATVTASWTFLIDRDPPSLNARIFNGAMGWMYRKERDSWCWEFRAIRLLQRIPKATSKRRVTFTRRYAGRQQERDQDNLVGGGKAVVDAIVLEGLLRGDSPTDAEIHWTQERASLGGLRVLLEELA